MSAGQLMILLEAYCYVYLHDAPHMDHDIENDRLHIDKLLRDGMLMKPLDKGADIPEFLPYCLTEKGSVFVVELLKTPLPERSWQVRRD